MNLPSHDEITRFDQRTRRYFLAARVISAVFVVCGGIAMVAPLVVGEPEALIVGVSIFVLGAAMLLLAIGRSDAAMSPVFFSVTQGGTWWNGLKVIAHLCAFVYAAFAWVTFAAPPRSADSSSLQTMTVGAIYAIIALVSLVAAILVDCNYFRRPASRCRLGVSPCNTSVGGSTSRCLTSARSPCSRRVPGRSTSFPQMIV